MIFYTIIFFFSFLVSSALSAESIVTCGSSIKISHKDTKFNLHSQGISWGSGSGQQAVTVTESKSDRDSLWLITEPHSSSKARTCNSGEPIKCGSIIRLRHVSTSKHLHSHNFRSPLSNAQEVSAFGDGSPTELVSYGDSGDNWQVICENSKEIYWMKNSPVQLKHVDTNKYLSANSKFSFHHGNCGHSCPILGQLEVSAIDRAKDSSTKWYVSQGIIISSLSNKNYQDDEL